MREHIRRCRKEMVNEKRELDAGVVLASPKYHVKGEWNLLPRFTTTLPALPRELYGSLKVDRAVSRQALVEQARRALVHVGLLSGVQSAIPAALARGSLNLPRKADSSLEMSRQRAFLHVAGFPGREIVLRPNRL